MKLLWMTDLHLERVSERVRELFLEKLRMEPFDLALITGDISDALRLPVDLAALSDACGHRTLYFVLGNHDYYGGSFDRVDAQVAQICGQRDNLCHLGHGELIRLTDATALVGHGGWADARCGYGKRTKIRSFDSAKIADFSGLSREEIFDEMENRGRESGNYFRKILPYALTCYEKLYVATHVPPFRWGAFFDGRLCGPLHLPHFTNQAAGAAINGIAQNFSGRCVTVLCGHTHSPVVYRASKSVEVFSGKVLPGRPAFQRVFDLN